MNTNNAAADFIWFLAVLTTIVPSVDVAEMNADDVLDARDGWDFAWSVDPTTSGGLYLPDGRVLRRFA